MKPLRFQPIYRRYLWGGRRLKTVLGKPLPDGDDFAESWELVDHGDDQSVVTHGEFAGTTLRQLLREHQQEILGRHGSSGHASFPLLIKFLDANKPLSVQVHPTDEIGAGLPQPDLGKTEAWLILHADPGSRIFAGFKRGFDRAAVEREVHRGTMALCLNSIEPKIGDCIFLPAGTVHALGAGLVVAEIQQSSDTTFRLFDWNRIGPDGKPRQLHVQQAMDTINFELGPIAPQVPTPLEGGPGQRLVACEKFVIDRWVIEEPRRLGGDERFHAIVVVQGEVQIEGDRSPAALRLGQTALIPAASRPLQITPMHGAQLLDVYLP